MEKKNGQSNEEVLKCTGDKRILLNNTARRNPNWTGDIIRRNCILHDTIDGKMTEVKGVERG